MKKQFIILIALVGFLLNPASRADGMKFGKENIVFKNVNVIPMNKEIVLNHYSLLVTDGKIEAIDRFENLKMPEGTKIINGQSRYLVPGFSDMHVHRYEQNRVLYLANGITLVRNMWGYPEMLREIKGFQSRQVPCSEVFSTGPIMDGKGSVVPGSFVIADPQFVAAAIKKMKADGYQAVKVYNQLSEEVYMEIMKTAKEVDLPVMGHVPEAIGVRNVLLLGQRSIEHVTNYFWDDDRLNKDLIDRIVKSGIWNCPTLVAFHKYNRLGELKNKKIEELKYVSLDRVRNWKNTDSLNLPIKKYEQTIKALSDQGARIVSGTDALTPYNIPGFSLHEELQYLNQAGLTPYQVLLTTTKNAAEMLGFEKRLGTIEKGKDADLVLLDKNPLEDIRNTNTITGVMVKGVWLSKEQLQEWLAQIAEQNK